jgi:hypothetical protein
VLNLKGFARNGGETEIRTLGGLQTHDGFQDRCLKPLSHLSAIQI